MLVVLPLAGAAAAAALAVDLPPTPTVTTPTVSTPVVTVPSVTVPPVTVTAPAPRVPSPIPTVPVSTTAPVTTTPAPAPPPVHVPTTTAAAGTTVSPSGAAQPSSGTASSRSSGSAAYSATPLDTAPSTSATQSSSAAARAVRRPVVAHFRVSRRAVVHVAVWQQAPRCRFIGRYTQSAANGANVLRIRRRVDGHRLGPGSYRFVARALGRKLVDVRVRFVRTRRSLLAVRRTGVEDVCTSQAFATFNTALVSAVPALGGNGAAATGNGGRASGTTHSSGTKSASGPTAPYRPPALAPPSSVLTSGTSRALLLALLVVAAGLLGLGSLPERAPVGGAIARHRAAVGAGGLALLLAAAIVLFF